MKDCVYIYIHIYVIETLASDSISTGKGSLTVATASTEYIGRVL